MIKSTFCHQQTQTNEKKLVSYKITAHKVKTKVVVVLVVKI